MKVFISWSGLRSKHIAEALSELLRMFFETVEPWMSSNDIEVGQRWASEIAGQLENTKYGIVCVTPENLTAPWINFEAGALAKSVDTGRVVPLLWDVRKVDLSNTGPLSQFQAETVSEDGIRAIVLGLNKRLENPRTEDVLNKLFDKVWPDFKGLLDKMPEADNPVQQEHRSTGEVLEELVTVVRSLDNRVSRLDDNLGARTPPELKTQFYKIARKLGNQQNAGLAEAAEAQALFQALAQPQAEVLFPEDGENESD